MSRRIEGIDVARGVASLIMIQGHAYHGWVADEHKASGAYLFTRLLGSLPLPAFLVLAGAAVVLRADAARRKDEDPVRVRRGVVRRGLIVVLWGYAANVVYALMDGYESIDTLLRADVLHVIGLSITALAFFGIRRQRGALAWTAAFLFVVPTLVSPWMSPMGDGVQGPWRFVAGLFIDVPGVTLMPFVPLSAWLGLGALVTIAMLRARRGEPAGAPLGFLLTLGLVSFVVAWLGSVATDAMLGDDVLSRGHRAVWANVVDLGARGVLVLALSAALSGVLPERAKNALIRLGQGSLIAYVFHIPFCYGRLGAALRGRLDMVEASAWLALLMAASWLVVRARDGWRDHRKRATGTSVGTTLC